VIVWKGDRRQTSGVGPYVLMPFTHYERLIGKQSEVDLP
jgi:hypothetical protein